MMEAMKSSLSWERLRPVLLGGSVACILLIGMLLRISVFDVTGKDYFHVDVARDYLIASHIVAYHDLPLVGPDNFLGPTFNSPAYYYIIAALLSLQNDFLFPGLVNVLLQILSIGMVFIAARMMFGSVTALIAVFLFAVSDGVVTESMQMWQPYLMQFILLCSYLALLHAYRTRQHAYLIVGLSLCAGAAIIHNSVWAVAPLYLIASVWVLRRGRAPLRDYVLCAAGPLLLFACAYVPNLYLALKGGGATVSGDLHFVLSAVILQSFSGLTNIYTYLLEGSLQGMTLYSFLIMAASLGGCIVYLLREREESRRVYFSYLLGLLASVTLAVGLLTLPNGGFPIRYFIPVYAVFFVLLAELCSFLLRKAPTVIVPLLCVAIVYAGWTSSEYVRSRLGDLPRRVNEMGWHSLYPRYVYPSDIDVLADYIQSSLRTADGRIRPFDVRTFQHGGEDRYANELMWVPLEWRFGAQLVRTDTHTLRGYVTREQPEVLFARCVDMEEKICWDLFLREYGTEYRNNGILKASEGVLYVYGQKNL
jgi:hypothetical protein